MEFDDCLKLVHRDLLRKHKDFAYEGRDEDRQRVFKLIDELEAIYPQLSDWHV